MRTAKPACCGIAGVGSKKPLGCGYAANGTVWICLDQRGPFEGTAREKRRWRELLDEAEDHELMADNDDEDSTTLLVPPAAKEALALVPSALMVPTPAGAAPHISGAVARPPAALEESGMFELEAKVAMGTADTL
ncbi:hypothetical protein M441DRAFT_44292 [Trichoderma asperellum CBS 433.97]|uniref:Uncharacterized protein n=1 Tax=Trichoderma asperellum (strain ATCC 204424 / CBS 433.97 / NBRC 101777) TaxID=1042311 RepID=A0A2T3ZHB1_TRIA4|nr:hypothetical protein M441DRAFT_44292 [Trichoderma asperellum CBS 433.97]PTB44205.1 hypothetical protein M441DRAFT_44292 [Trichoderma asperellum CBS 433.97]